LLIRPGCVPVEDLDRSASGRLDSTSAGSLQSPPTVSCGLRRDGGDRSGEILRGSPEEALYAGALIVITVLTVNVLGERFATRWEAPGR
jgi:hypothetical protein